MTVAAVFDMDGTLVTFKFDVKGTRKAILEELGKRGYDTSALDMISPTQRILDVVKVQAEERGDGEYAAVRAEIFSILDAFESKSAILTLPFPGAKEALLGLKERGVRLAVLTNSGRGAAAVALGAPGLTDLFEFVLTREDTDTMKPRPEGLLMAVSRLGLPKEFVAYVGDSLLDVQAAQAAGVRLISVATGNYPRERLVEAGSSTIVSSLSEVAGALGV